MSYLLYIVLKYLIFFRLWNKESPSGKLNVIIRNITTKKEEEKQYIEV